jgi:hypothetical protein
MCQRDFYLLVVSQTCLGLGYRGLVMIFRAFVLLEATTFCWSMWLCMNEIVFDKKPVATPLQVIYSVMHWLRT